MLMGQEDQGRSVQLGSKALQRVPIIGANSCAQDFKYLTDLLQSGYYTFKMEKNSSRFLVERSALKPPFIIILLSART